MKLETKLDSVSYSLGVNIGESLKGQGLTDLDSNLIAQGLMDYLNDADLQVKAADVMPLIQEYMGQKAQEMSQAMVAEGEKFLKENGERAEVTVLESGLQYEVIESGSGATPNGTSQVTTHYTGMLINGQVFDSSVQRGQPATFGVNQVIAGWTEALQLMKEGDKWRLFIPHTLAYGERGAGQDIPPFATLIFEIELIKVD